MSTPTFTQIGSDGNRETYADVYKEVTDEMVQRAQDVEEQIHYYNRSLELNYLHLARHLSTFKRERLFLARGYPTFKEWANSPEIRLNYRSAARLVQIADEALPLLQARGKMDQLPAMSTLSDLLPILHDENGEDKFIEALEGIQGLTNRDAKQWLKEFRGQSESLPPIYKAEVHKGENFHQVNIIYSGADGYYTVGSLNIRRDHWALWENRFGRMYEIVDQL